MGEFIETIFITTIRQLKAKLRSKYRVQSDSHPQKHGGTFPIISAIDILQIRDHRGQFGLSGLDKFARPVLYK